MIANIASWFLFSSAVRFGRIPKREKQRLLDEMQSYMNSLNESASMEIDSTTSPEAPSSPENQSNEGVGSISQSYCNIFSNDEEKPLKMAANNSNNNGPSSFQNNTAQDSAYSQSTAQTQTGPIQGYQSNPTSGYNTPARCPVAPNNNNPASTNVDNAKYTYAPSSNQRQCPVSGSLSSQSYPANNHNSIPARDSQNQNSCPWKLNGGAKVLVSVCLGVWIHISSVYIYSMNMYTL